MVRYLIENDSRRCETDTASARLGPPPPRVVGSVSVSVGTDSARLEVSSLCYLLLPEEVSSLCFLIPNEDLRCHRCVPLSVTGPKDVVRGRECVPRTCSTTTRRLSRLRRWRTLGSSVTAAIVADSCKDMDYSCHSISDSCHSMNDSCHSINDSCNGISESCNGMKDSCEEMSDSCYNQLPSCLFYVHHKWDPSLLHTKIPVATWRLAEIEFFSTKIPIAKWRLKEFYMEKKNKVYRGTATSFGFKKPALASTNNNNPIGLPPPVPNNQDNDSTTRTGTPRLARPKKETNSINARTNRFGFRPPPTMSNKVADSQNTKANLRLEGLVKEEAVKTHIPRISQLPRPQFPVRLATPAGYHSRTASADKSAKTAANNNTARRSRSENGGSSASSVNDADSGVSSQRSGNELEMIEQLECSPSARNRLRKAQKSRPMEMIFPNGNEKKFELRDMQGSIEVTEILPLELPPLPMSKRLMPRYDRLSSRESGSSEDDEGIDEESGEEKLHRDRVLSEKDEKGVVGAGDEPAGEVDDLWGHGEAMVGEEDLTNSGQESDPGPEMTPPLRSVLLSIEDHSFAALAAMSSSAMLEDECYPELPDFQNSLSLTSTSNVTSPNESPPQEQQEKKNDDSPGTPGTPTHTSNSLSLSSDIRDRDFIDDEICDQPGLVYNNMTANSSGNTLVADAPSPRPLKPLSAAIANLTIDCNSGRHSSVGTLSPCESIASDDLIMDYDISAVEEDHRLDTSSVDAPLSDVEGEGEVDEDFDLAVQELSMLSNRPDVLEGTWLMNGVRATRQLRARVGSSGSGADSPRSLDTPRSALRSLSALSSPLRSSRQGTSSPGEDLSEDSGIRVQRVTYQSMYQDVINIKALLLKLSRVMQENENESANETTQKNGFCSDGSVDHKNDSLLHEKIADLERQVVFLQSQKEEAERTIRQLQASHPPPPEHRGTVDTCNAATQTERIRPLSTGPILSTQPDSAGGSLVSNASDSTRQVTQILQPRPVSRLPQWRRPSSPSSDLHRTLNKKT
ncbi:uncharacterized protein LOC129002145 [Macrosteles quadrilineatus]|uniref:uncharacterized protein LOC129002145 n=1 Tax=Macrosteles quadrilineatus TaxID=74068 RepID=UPI0023E2F2FE|nr:uncharacterized protein LOC129002145 [Macrosteles quadrilineatus]